MLGQTFLYLALSSLLIHPIHSAALSKPVQRSLQDRHDLKTSAAGISATWTHLVPRMMMQDVPAAVNTDVVNPSIPTQNMSTADGVTGSMAGSQLGVITHPTYDPRVINCSDLRTGRDNKCWDDLNLTLWVKEWIADNHCYEDEPFASCFLRKENYNGLDCTGVKPNACTAPPSAPGLDPRVFYVAYNIYAINQFFTSWYTAVGSSANLALQNTDTIVHLIDPPTNTHLIIDHVLLVLTGLFAVIPALGIEAEAITGAVKASESGVSKEVYAAGQFLEGALFAVPQIGRFLFPIDTPASALLQISALKSRTVDLIKTVQGNINKTLVSVMSDPQEFLAFASQGNFTANAPSLPDQEEYLLYAFNTYLISACLAGNNVYGTIARDTDVQQLATNASSKHLNWDFSKCRAYNEQGICDAWWYSKRYNSTFGLDDFSHMGRDYGKVLTTLLANYTTGELLFEAAFACNSDGKFGSPVNVTVNAAGVNTQCLSQLKIVTWDMSCTDPTSDSSCEFIEIPRQPSFFAYARLRTPYGGELGPLYAVPYTYLGPLASQRGSRLKRD